MILLDRDGVLNEMVVDAEHGTVDSPMHPDQVKLCDGAAEAVARLHGAGHRLVVVTNQPAVAKGKTTSANLDAVHDRVLSLLAEGGGAIVDSFACRHRREDACACRKPATGMLDAAFQRYPDEERATSWMVGDGVTDVEAGRAAGLRTAFVGPQKCCHCKVFDERGGPPDFWGPDLAAVAEHLLTTERS